MDTAPSVANDPSRVVSAIVNSEEELEQVIGQLERDVVGRHQISVQGSPGELAKCFNAQYLDPEVIQDSDDPPKKEPFLVDDFGWVVGFSLAIPMFICAIVGFLILGEPQSPSDYFLSSAIGIILGAAVGALIGMNLIKVIKKQRNTQIGMQEQKGGFVLWVTAMSAEQSMQIISVLKENHARHILVK